MIAEVLRSSGSVHLGVKGASMLPEIWPGDILTISRLGAAEPLPGDIVLYGREGRLVAHRLIKVRSPKSEVRGREAGFRIWDLGFRGRRSTEIASHQSPGTSPVSRTPSPVSRLEFVTRGDSMRQNDPPISSHELLGRVVSLTRGSRTVIPHRSPAARIASWILSHSEFVTRVVLKTTPVFHTPSKAAYGPPVGIDSLREVTSLLRIPVFALGGITSRNTRQVLDAGAHGIALISAVIGAENPAVEAKTLLALLLPGLQNEE